MRFRSLPSRADLIWLIAIIYKYCPGAGGNTRSHYVSRLKAEPMLSRRLNGQTARILARRRHLTSAVKSRRGASPNFGDTTYSMRCVLINHLAHLVYVCVVSAWVRGQWCRVSHGIVTEQTAIGNLSEYLPAFSPWLSQARTSVCPCTADPPKPSSDGLRYKNTH